MVVRHCLIMQGTCLRRSSFGPFRREKEKMEMEKRKNRKRKRQRGKKKKEKGKKQVYSLMDHMSRERDDLCPEGFFFIDGSNCVFLGSSRPSRMSPRRRRSQIMRTLSRTTTRFPTMSVLQGRDGHQMDTAILFLG